MRDFELPYRTSDPKILAGKKPGSNEKTCSVREKYPRDQFLDRAYGGKGPSQAWKPREKPWELRGRIGEIPAP